MSDDEPDHDLLDFLRQHFQNAAIAPAIPETQVLDGAEYVYDNAIDVAIDYQSTKAAAAMIYEQMQKKEYSTKTWSTHELHPKTKDESTVAFIFTMDLLNFSFWSEKGDEERFAIEYKGKRWTGYWSLVAALRRALDEDIPITSSDFWQNEHECKPSCLSIKSFTPCDATLVISSSQVGYPSGIFPTAAGQLHLQHRGNAKARLQEFKRRRNPPLQRAHGLSPGSRPSSLRGTRPQRTHPLPATLTALRKYSCSFTNCIIAANNSAAALVNLLADDFPCFNDVVRFEKRKSVRLLKRAQICVADLWAAFEGEGFGEFHDIDKITMFADYRVPQILNTLGCLWYSPLLDLAVRQKKKIESGHTWEVQMRGCSIWCVELIRREILRGHPEARINAILIDFFLYDTMKEREGAGQDEIPHHRTRSIWY
ncbi:hypothetical protein JHW43_002549 [Diplocarpon mali]|nr:hypothetical protein JHW43_002549 [Diplocarpon mali]